MTAITRFMNVLMKSFKYHQQSFPQQMLLQKGKPTAHLLDRVVFQERNFSVICFYFQFYEGKWTYRSDLALLDECVCVGGDLWNFFYQLVREICAIPSYTIENVYSVKKSRKERIKRQHLLYFKWNTEKIDSRIF